MKGVLLISHGEMAVGMLDSISFFMPDIPQLGALVLKVDDSPEEFRELVEKKITELDSGDGVIIFADMLGGTPANQSAYLMSEQIDIITGMSLNMVLECLALRELDNLSITQICQVGKGGISHLNKLFEEGRK